MGVKLGRSYWERNVSWGFSRIGCWGGYLGLRGARWQGSGEDYIKWSFMLCNPRQILFGWQNLHEWDRRGITVYFTKRINHGQSSNFNNLVIICCQSHTFFEDLAISPTRVNVSFCLCHGRCNTACHEIHWTAQRTDTFRFRSALNKTVHHNIFRSHMDICMHVSC
jgi:hypothetical protein